MGVRSILHYFCTRICNRRGVVECNIGALRRWSVQSEIGKACGGRRIKMSGQREAQVRNGGRGSLDRGAPDRDDSSAQGPSRLFVFVVRRLASYEKCRKNWEGSQIIQLISDRIGAMHG